MNEPEPASFDHVTAVVRDPLHFKYKLDIGEDAYQSLRIKKYLLDAVDAGNGAIVGFGAAKSSLVASTFFAPSGFLGAIGIGTAATPLGWAIAAGVVGAGLSLVIGKRFIRGSSKRVRSIPECINTPLDLLAVGLFDLIATLGVKVALVDGHFDPRERDRLKTYFVDEWGYDEAFVAAGLAEIEQVHHEHTIRKIAEQLAQFKKENPDCRYETMAAEIIGFLKALIEVDGKIDTRELIAIEEVETVFEEVNSLQIGKAVHTAIDKVADTGKKTAGTVQQAVTKVTDLAKQKIAGKRDQNNND